MTRRATISLVAALSAAIAFPGCNLVGPKAIGNGRSVYNEMINKTEDEQVLDIILRERYDESFGMLTVASVTSNISFRSNVGGEVGIGPSQNYDGNLVPLSAGFAYEENPTISYVPLSGEIFYQRTLAPVTLAHAYLMAQASETRSPVFGLMVQRVNGIENPPPGREPFSDEYEELTRALKDLHDTEVMKLVRSDDGRTYYLSIADYKDQVADVRTVIDTLKLDTPEPDGQALLIPVNQTLGGVKGTINLETRSPLEVIRIIGESIEIPREHLEVGIAEAVEPVDQATEFLRIHSSPTYPEHASVATEFHGYWFYIDSRDATSKRGFVLVRTLIGMRLYDESTRAKAPTLTLPVSN